MLGVVEDGAVLVEHGRIAAVGPASEVMGAADGAPTVVHASESVITPGLVDAHTHLAWAGSRHAEYALRMQGAEYEAIAAAGGGIVATMSAVRQASRAQIEDGIRRRLRRMASLGVTTCEIKSGYGLSLESEIDQLEAIHAARDDALARIVPTFLALHALPPEARADRARWVAEVVDAWLPEVVEKKLARFVDAYIDRNAFQVDEAEKLFTAAADQGLGIRAHVGQFADIGGASLAASLGAASVDHLEHVEPAALEALANAGTRAVLLPMACFTLRQNPPPVEAIRAAGVPMVVASDANPGSAPTESLGMSLALALRTYGMTPNECILGATRHAAESLGLGDECGRLCAGHAADLVVWDLPHELAILQPWASPVTRLVMREGRTLCSSEG